MTDEQRDILATPVGVSGAEAPIAIDANELAQARLDERWRKFCLDAEDYVAATTRPRPSHDQAGQLA